MNRYQMEQNLQKIAWVQLRLRVNLDVIHLIHDFSWNKFAEEFFLSRRIQTEYRHRRVVCKIKISLDQILLDWRNFITNYPNKYRSGWNDTHLTCLQNYYSIPQKMYLICNSVNDPDIYIVKYTCSYCLQYVHIYCTYLKGQELCRLVFYMKYTGQIMVII